MLPFEKINALTAAMPNLDARGKEFAGSLLQQFKMRGDLSEKQWPWVDKLLANKVKPQAVRLEADLSGLHAIFDKAQESGLKWPALRAIATDAVNLDTDIVVRYGTGGKLNITSTGSFENRTYYGNIVDGVFNPSMNANKLPKLVAELEAFAKSPLEGAKAFGRKTGTCCFCARELTDATSMANGYGPICAEKWLG